MHRLVHPAGRAPCRPIVAVVTVVVLENVAVVVVVSVVVEIVVMEVVVIDTVVVVEIVVEVDEVDVQDNPHITKQRCLASRPTSPSARQSGLEISDPQSSCSDTP